MPRAFRSGLGQQLGDAATAPVPDTVTATNAAAAGTGVLQRPTATTRRGSKTSANEPANENANR